MPTRETEKHQNLRIFNGQCVSRSTYKKSMYGFSKALYCVPLCAPLPAALPERASELSELSNFLRDACAQPAAQSPGDARTCVRAHMGDSCARSQSRATDININI